jgi:predicted PurR-regulated permease PerM
MSDSASSSYGRRVATVVGLAALVVGLMYLLHSITKVFLLGFAGILLAAFLTGLTRYVKHRTPLGRGAALTLIVAGLIALFAGVGMLAGPRLSAQFGQLSERLPEAVKQITKQIKNMPWGQAMLAQAPRPKEVLIGGGSSLVGRLTGVFSTALSGLTNLLVVLIIGLYLAVDPETYRRGVLRLVPPDGRNRANDVYAALAHALRWWLVGRLASMAVVGTFTATGLFIAGVPLAFTLGLISALFSFVPYVGPIVSMIPAILVALTKSPQLVVWVLVVYGVVQLLESYAITPVIQERAVEIPPALLVAAQVLMGVVAGVMGVLVATPLTVGVIVLVQMLYVESVLGDRVDIMGND